MLGPNEYIVSVSVLGVPSHAPFNALDKKTTTPAPEN